ncbi:MAG: hypothetical protein AB7P69_09650 [Candidatus Binatia bacterium]
MNKQLKFAELVSRTYLLDDIDQSMTARQKREAARSVLSQGTGMPIGAHGMTGVSTNRQ